MAYVRIVYAGVSQANHILRKAIGELDWENDTCVYSSETDDSIIQSRNQIAEHLRRNTKIPKRN